MHEPARLFVARFATERACSVYEVGSRNVNGSVRDLFPAASWLGIDVRPGPNVDLVADGANWTPELGVYDFSISTEVFEHTREWRSILRHLIVALRPGGRVIVTAAGPNRRPHSAEDGGPWVGPDEWYCPIFPSELRSQLARADLTDMELETDSDGVYASAVRR